MFLCGGFRRWAGAKKEDWIWEENIMADTVIPGLEGIACAESNISFINGLEGVLEYRGYNITTLAENGTFEEVAYLLLKGELPTQDALSSFTSDLAGERHLEDRMIEILRNFPADGHPMKALQAGVAVLGAFDTVSNVNDEAQASRATIRLIAKVPTLIAAYHRVRSGQEPVAPRSDLDHAANFLYMLNGEVPSDTVARTMDVCLVLHMEHTMNASTFTGRVVASTLADPYAVVSGAVGSLTGPLHGGANERALRALEAIPNVESVDEIIGGKIERKEKIMGLGHRVYKTKDPRATILQGLADTMFTEEGSTQTYEVAKRIEAVATERLGAKGIYPNVDFYSGIVYDRMGIPSDIFTPIFAVARVVGWLAHWKAQLVGTRIFRPTQVYTGFRERSYTPMSER
jgi:citrate synthase